MAFDPSAEGGVRPRPRSILGAALVAFVVAAWLTPSAALGHGGPGRLVVEPPEAPPGGTVVIRGEDLSADQTMAVWLIGPAGGVELGTVTTDGTGHFALAVAIPAEVEVGTYGVELVAVGGEAASAELVIGGAPVEPDPSEPARDEDDPLLIALPSGWQQSLSGPSITARPVAVDRPADALPPPAGGILAAAAVFVSGLLLALLARRRRPS